MINEYSKALFELANDDKQIEFCKESFDAFNKLYQDNLDLKRILESPKIKNSDKKKIISNSLESLYKEFVLFLNVIIDNGRTNELEEIYDDFLKLYREQNKIKLCKVISKKKITSEEKTQIINVLKNKFYGYQIVIDNIIDESLIGGFHLICDGKSIDLSIKNQMKELKESI